METKAIVLAVLNAAITSFKERGGKVYSGDIVIDYNPDNVGVASFIDRHPGWIKLYVTLKEGTGLFFIKSETTMFGNDYYIAWEEDDDSNHLQMLYKDDNDVLYNLVCIETIERELEEIISKGLSICR